VNEDDVAEIQPWVERKRAELDPLGAPKLRVPCGAALGGQATWKEYRDASEGHQERADPRNDRAPRMTAAGASEALGHGFEFPELRRAAQLFIE
jgi:hypothetical protein